MIRTNSNKILILLVTLVIGIASENAQAEDTSIRVKNSARVSGRVVLLKDVAYINSEEAVLVNQLGNIELGNSPQPGFSKYIPRETIENRIRTQGLDKEGMTLSGAEGVNVQVKSMRISGEELFNLGREFLTSELASLEGEYMIEIVRNPSAVLVPVGNGLTTFNVKWRNVPRSSGIVTLDIRILVDSELFSTVTLQLKIRRFAYVLIATQEIDRGEPFTANNTTVARTEVTQVKGNIAQTTKEMALYLAKQRVNPGDVIREEIGYLPNIIERGQAVRVTVRRGALSIQSRGVARQSGAFGDTIEIMNPDSGNTFRSTITGSGQVTVKL